MATVYQNDFNDRINNRNMGPVSGCSRAPKVWAFLCCSACIAVTVVLVLIFLQKRKADSELKKCKTSKAAAVLLGSMSGSKAEAPSKPTALSGSKVYKKGNKKGGKNNKGKNNKKGGKNNKGKNKKGGKKKEKFLWFM